jgi:cytochrome c oxidase cbb3-type subunit III
MKVLAQSPTFSTRVSELTVVSSMFSRTMSFRVMLSVLTAILAVSVAGWGQTQPKASWRKDIKPDSAAGKRTFASTCANCHGLDGRGGERAPDIAERPRVQQLSDAQLFKIIENGIPETGMPAFHSLPSPTIKAIVIYLRTLQGARWAVNLPGDPAHGESIFTGKAGCSGCHMVAGKGGFIAIDLSDHARAHTVEQIRKEITNPPNNDHRARMVTATVHSGEKYTGRVRNEDNFSLQLQTLDGMFHFLEKSEIETLEYSAQPLMPSDYGSTLSPDELNDVVSFLMRVASTNATQSETAEKKSLEE